MADSSPFITVMTNIFDTEFSEFSEKILGKTQMQSIFIFKPTGSSLGSMEYTGIGCHNKRGFQICFPCGGYIPASKQ